MEFQLTLKLGNAAMLTGEDVAGVLQRAAGWIELYAEMSPGEGSSILDQNGNRVGGWKVTE